MIVVSEAYEDKINSLKVNLAGISMLTEEIEKFITRNCFEY